MSRALWIEIIAGLLYVFVIGPIGGGLLSGLDRLVSARMQGRQGPPIRQAFFDLSKLFQKRAGIVNHFQSILVVGHMVFVVFTGILIYTGNDFLLSLFTLTLGEMFFCMAAASASGPYSGMGSQRELVQLMCTEPMRLIMAIGFYLSTTLDAGTSGSFMVRALIHADVPAIVRMPGIFIGFLTILIVELRKSPFDVSTSHHAHQEMVKGITTDLSGNIMGITEMTEWYEEALMFTIVGLFFIDRHPVSILWAVLAALAVFFLENLIDNVFPRVKWETMFKACWVSTFVCGGSNLLVLLLLVNR